MRRRRKINLILLISVLVSVLSYLYPSSVSACSCAEPERVDVQFDLSEAVFAGRVLEVKEQRNLKGYLWKSALFEVNQIWKGGSESQIMIHTGTGGGDCGYPFEAGEEYLVYARSSTIYGEKERLVSSICDRTKAIHYAQEDLDILGKGAMPLKQVNLKNEMNLLNVYAWLIVTGVAAIGILLIYYWRKLRK